MRRRTPYANYNIHGISTITTTYIHTYIHVCVHSYIQRQHHRHITITTATTTPGRTAGSQKQRRTLDTDAVSARLKGHAATAIDASLFVTVYGTP